MPISGPTSYFATTQAFLNHWDDANAASTTGPISLDKTQCGTAADVVRNDLVALLSSLETARDVIEGTAQDVSIFRSGAVAVRTWLLEQMNLFNQTMRADHGTSAYAQNLEAVPSPGAGREAFMKPMRATARLWAVVDNWRVLQGLSALALSSGVDQAAFFAKVAEGRTALDQIEEREQQVTIERAKRDMVQVKIYAILKVYRLKIPALFAEGSAILTSLPLLTPEPGSTPAAPGLSGGWNVGQNRAEFTGTASPTPAVTQHQLRGCPQAEFDEDLETVVATIEVGQPLTFQTTFGLTQAGATASFRLVAMTGDGHERGSAPVVVSRPV